MIHKIIYLTGGVSALSKRLRLVMAFALLGLFVAVVFYALFEVDPQPESAMALWTGGLALLFCPGSCLFIALGLIDVEVRTGAFLHMWGIVTLINIIVYGAMGAVIGSFMWTGDDGDPPGSL